jgi:hypothetical protein
LAVGTGLAYSDGEVRIDSDADFEFVKTMYFSTNDNANVYLKYRDDSTGRFLMRSAASARTIGGRSLAVDNSGAFDFRPFLWPLPYKIRRGTTFMVQAANSHAAIAPTVYLAFHGAKVRQGIAPWKQPALKMPYVYGLTRSAATLPEGVVQIAANATVTSTISVDKDSSFCVTKITGSATGNCLVTIQEQGRDRQWSNAAVHIRNLIGSGAEPNILPSPRFLEKGSVVSISMQDLSGAANNVEMNFVGFKLFSR